MAGAGYKLFNTGDVLTAAQVNTYLMEQTVMVFANAAARTTALSGVVSEGMISYLKDTNAVEVYDGSNWVSSDDPNAIQNTIVDAKGDLITASASDVPARLAVGNNGETLVADSSTSTGLRYNPQNALANPFINGGMDIWARGTSGTANSISAGAGYNADRWQNYSNGNAITVSRQATGDTTNLPNIQYCARVQRNSGQTSTNEVIHAQSLESVNCVPFAGKTVTLSFYARAGANYSAASSNLYIQMGTGTGTDQNFLAGFTGAANPISQNVTISTTWQRFAISATLASNITQIGLQIKFTPVGTAGANDWFEVTGVQIDLGTYTASTAPAFRRSGGTLAGELAACQRYYYRVSAGSTAGYYSFGGAYANSSSAAIGLFPSPVTMRTVPTVLDFAGLAFQNFSNSVFGWTSIYIEKSSPNYFYVVGTVSGATAGHTGVIQSNNNNTGYIGFGAEL